MNDFFASLYEFFGLAPLYSKDLGDHLRGLDITCQGYVGSPLYIYIGISMILVTFFTYALQYHIIDSNRYNKLYHWWITSAILIIINFFIAFSIPNNDRKLVKPPPYKCNSFTVEFLQPDKSTRLMGENERLCKLYKYWILSIFK